MHLKFIAEIVKVRRATRRRLQNDANKYVEIYYCARVFEISNYDFINKTVMINSVWTYRVKESFFFPALIYYK